MTALALALIAVLMLGLGALLWRARPDPTGIRRFRRRFQSVVRTETLAYYYGDDAPMPWGAGLTARTPLTILDVDARTGMALVEGSRTFTGTVVVLNADGSFYRRAAPSRPVADIADGMFRVPVMHLFPEPYAPELTAPASAEHSPAVSPDGRIDGSSP